MTTHSGTGTRASTGLPPLVVADGTLEALKWVALALMTLDHVNKFLFAERLPVVFEAGRVVMPLFGFVLAYNLARPQARASGAQRRTMKRLTAYALLATPMFVALVGWWPLNILFTLLLSASIIHLLDRGTASGLAAAALLFAAAGALVEFWWFAVAYCLAAWAYCRHATFARLLLWVGATASLAAINGNPWAMAALPVIFAAPYITMHVPRHRTWFYRYYPTHLAVLWAVQVLWLPGASR
jgi:hypothetical protein